ncbi:MAG: carbohydrate kinase [Actinobacteria bacterium]|nr:carbohydrate kinase [Actinomycetota bacterium]
MILVIGEALIDLIGKADGGGKYQAVVGGANANVALALARRGQDQKFLGRISSDGFGQIIRDRLASNGVDLSWSIAAKEQTSLAVATIGEGGSASYSFYLNGTADWAWTPRELPTAAQIAEVGANCIQYGCLTMAVNPGSEVVSDWLASLADITRSHDLNIRSALGFRREAELERVLRINQYSDIIKASDADLWWLFDLAEGSDLDEICHAWSSDSRLVVLTRGGDGASLYRSGKRVDVSAPKISLVDTVGAGDTYIANFLGELSELDALGSNPRARLAKLSDTELISAASFAAVAAGLVCERQGCEPPTKAEVEAILAR